MKRSLLFAPLLVVLVFGASGCKRSDHRLVAAHLIDHFRKNKLVGRYQNENPEAIGALQAGRYSSRRGSGPQFDLEFAKFDDPRKARRLAQRGYREPSTGRVFKVYANGPFIMLVREAPKNVNVVKIFKDF